MKDFVKNNLWEKSNLKNSFKDADSNFLHAYSGFIFLIINFFYLLTCYMSNN